MTIDHSSGPDQYPAASEAARIARRTRYEAAVARARRARRIALGVVGALAVVAAAWWTWSPSGLASSGDAALLEGSSFETAGSEIREAPQPPTPVFARYGDFDMHLAVAERDLTEIGFHRAARDNALPIESFLPDADMTAADGNNGTGRVPAQVDPDDFEPRVLGGTVLRMWRSSRPGAPDTAVDIGAPPGATVFAPVNGTVIAITTYELYGKHEDIEIHIQPTGTSDIDLVIIHVEDVSVHVGEIVTAGVTPLAKVRLLSDRIDHQLGQYSTTPGDHVHIQLNRIEAPGRTVPADES